MRPKSSTIGATLVKAHSDSMCAFLDLHSNTLIIRQEACFIPTAAVGQQESRGRNHSHIVCLSGFSRLLNTCAPVADQARSTLYCLSAPLLHCTGFFGTKSSLIRSLLCLRVGFHPTHNGKKDELSCRLDKRKGAEPANSLLRPPLLEPIPCWFLSLMLFSVRENTSSPQIRFDARRGG